MSVPNDPRVNGHPGGKEIMIKEEGNLALPGGSQHPVPHTIGSANQYCCLLENSRPCNRPASNASYSKRIQGTVAQRKLKLQLDTKAQHTYICEFHKSVIQTNRTKRQRQDSEESLDGADAGNADMVDFFQLQMNTLRRYKKHFKVTSRPGVNKAQLADSLTRHFKTIPVIEKEALTYFIYMVKTKRSKLDEVPTRPGGVM